MTSNFRGKLYRLSEYAISVWNNKNRQDLLEILPKNSVGAEIGVYRGDFAQKIFNTVQPKRLHLIDPWWLLGQKKWSFSLIGQSVIGGYTRVLKKFEKEILENKVVIEVGFSQEVLKKYPDNYFDWVYLDSSHLYEQTLDELELLKDKVKDSGFVCGHDWQPDPQKKHHGLYRAVNEFVENNSYDIIYLDKATQWAVRKK